MATIECICPAKPDGSPRHESDTVTLRPALGFTSALAIRNVIRLMSGEPGIGTADILASISESYLYHGIESWSLVDAKNKPIPVDREAIRDHLLSHPLAAYPVADEADDLYAAAVVLPLFQTASTSSPGTPTDDSTSAPTDLPSSPPKPLKRSSTITSRTDATATTTLSPAGVSN